jgi:hypothetical protein
MPEQPAPKEVSKKLLQRKSAKRKPGTEAGLTRDVS